MFLDFTPGVGRALQAAEDLARRLGSLVVEPEHLLHGLLHDEEERASVLLSRAGLDPAAVRGLFAARAAQEPVQPLDTPLPLSPLAQQVMVSARQLARELSPDRTLWAEQVLLALLQVDEDLRGQLEPLGLLMARLEEDVLASRGPPLHLEEPLRLPATTEEIDTGRILDAGANRAREALRVVEDYCRFVLDDAILSGELKRLRHELADILAQLPRHSLLAARETLRDVGTRLSTLQEKQRHSLLAVVQANWKRLQEALRSLEEFSKLHDPRMSQALEQMRYDCYTLERATVLGAMARQRLAEVKLYVLVTGSLCTAALDWTIKEAAAGGARMFQLREKKLGDAALLERARHVRRWTREAGVLFIMNDRPDIARLVEADGVHVGQDELPVKEVRRIVGPEALIGVSTHNLEQVRQALLDGASYIGVGPIFPSGTKDFTEFLGLEFVRQATAETSLPAFVIGGVTPENIEMVVAAGGRRVAVSQAICQADDPQRAAADLLRTLEEAETSRRQE